MENALSMFSKAIVMEFYSVIKKNEFILFAIKWIKLGIIMLAEIIDFPRLKKCVTVSHDLSHF
jgi:hypothetical protein